MASGELARRSDDAVPPPAVAASNAATKCPFGVPYYRLASYETTVTPF
jgi:hypothetical protein